MNKKQLIAVIKIIVGNLFMAFAYAKWMKPNTIINGGVTSVGMILEKITGLNILYLTNGTTLLLLIICWFFLGKENFVKSLFSSICYMAFFSFFYALPIDISISLYVDFLLASLFISIGYYCCLSSNASTVGMDVIALVLHKKNNKLNLVKTIRYINYLVLIFGLVTFGMQSVVIGIIFSFAYSFFLEILMKKGKQREPA